MAKGRSLQQKQERYARDLVRLSRKEAERTGESILEVVARKYAGSGSLYKGQAAINKIGEVLAAPPAGRGKKTKPEPEEYYEIYSAEPYYNVHSIVSELSKAMSADFIVLNGLQLSVLEGLQQIRRFITDTNKSNRAQKQKGTRIKSRKKIKLNLSSIVAKIGVMAKTIFVSFSQFSGDNEEDE